MDYLQKKVWHPGRIQNIERVWKKEKQQVEFHKKQKEREAKLLEERISEQLKVSQIQQGYLPQSYINRLDWMYDEGNKLSQQQKQQSYEEYLQGKAITNVEEFMQDDKSKQN